MTVQPVQIPPQMFNGAQSNGQMMFMVAPMSAPVMMPQFDSSGMVGYGAVPANVTNTPFTWTVGTAWPHLGEPLFQEEAPMQLPMDAGAPMEFPQQAPVRYTDCEFATSAGWHSHETVPEQIQMDASVLPPPVTDQVQKKNGGRAGTLRHRRAQECSVSPFQGVVTDLPKFDEPLTEHVRGTDTEAAQVRGIASRMAALVQAGGDEKQSALAGFERLAFASNLSCRAAQMVLDQASVNDAAAFAAGLRGRVRSAVQSKHANHVVQKIIEVMPVSHASFVVDELKGVGLEVARHAFGCRVLCRILEHLSPSDSSTLELIEEVLADLDELCNHSFGSFVVRHLLEFGLPEHRHRVVTAIQKDLAGYAKHKFGSHVVESALRHASPEDQHILARELVANREHLMVLAANQFGRHVVRAMLAMPGGIKKEVVGTMLPMEDRLKSSRYGKSVLQALRAATAA
jgi:hypothetical protein